MKNKLLYIILVALILSVSLNMILLSNYVAKEKEMGLDKKQAKLDKHVLDLIEDRPFRVELSYYPAMDMDEFRDLAKNYRLKPVIFSGNNFGNKKGIDEQIIKKGENKLW